MLLIVDNTKRKELKRLRRDLHRSGVPCVVANTSKFDLFLPCKHLIVTEKYLVKDVSYYTETFYKDHVINVCRDEYHPYDAVSEYVRDKILPDIHDFRKGYLTRHRGMFFFCGRRMYLTKEEKLIVNLLLINNTYTPWESIISYCFGNKTSKSNVTSIVSLINRKSCRITGCKLIKCLRYKGYYLNYSAE